MKTTETALNKEIIQKKMLSIRDLPTIPIIIAQIIKVVQNENSSSRDLAKILEKDQGLTSKILRISNSAYYGRRGKITNITKATILLGFEIIKNLSISISVINVFKGKINNSFFNLKSFWTHSIAVGIASRIIATECNQKDTETLFTLGIVHDLGKLILIHLYPKEYQDALKLVEEENIPIRKAEQKIFEIDHTIIGSWLAKKWNLPNIFIEIIKNHHRPSQNLQYSYENAILCLADNLCKDMKIGHSGDYITNPLPPTILQMINIDINQVTQISLKLNEEKEEINELIGAIN